MTTKPDGASQPDVLTRQLPATSSTSDMPDVTATIEVATPPTSESGGQKPVAAEPAKSAPSKENPAEGEVKAAPVEGEKPAAEGDAGTKKPKDGINERFSKLTSDRKAAEEKARNEESARLAADQRADKLARDLETALAAINKVVPPEPENVRPTRAQYDDPDKYDQALATWAERMGAQKAKAEAEANFTKQRDDEAKAANDTRVKAENERIAATWKDRSDKFTAETPDFQEAIMSDDVQITPIMGQAILTSEIGPQVAYHLAKNPKEATEIAAMQPHAQLLALGRLEARLSAPPKPKTTTTPDPISPIAGNRAASAATKSPHEESMDEYAARRTPELRSKPNGARS